MNYSLISQKLRELAELFDEQAKVKPAEIGQTKPAKATKTKEPVTLDTIRTEMAKLIGAGKRTDALAILAKVCVAKVSEIPEDKFDFVMVAIDEAR